MSRQGRAYLFAILTIVCWSTVATAFKIGLRYLSVLHFILVASFTSFLIFSLIILFQKSWPKIFAGGIKAIGRSALLGILNPLAYYLILFEAYRLLPAQVAQPLNMVWPIVLSFLSIPLLKQKLRKKHILAIFISFTGVFFISAQGNLGSLNNINIPGVLMALSSSIIWSLYWIFNVKDNRPELIKLFWNFLFGTLYLFIIGILFSDLKIEWGAGVLTGIYVGFFELGFAFVFWMKAMQLSENNAQIGNLIYVVPFISLVFIHLILHETIYYTTFVGLFFIIGGIFIQQMKRL